MIREVMRMIYLSKGVAQKNSTEQLLYISRIGQSFQLTGIEATLWLNGRFQFAVAKGTEQERALDHLNRMGLTEREPENTAVSQYRILTKHEGGTAYTVDYAKQNGLDIINVVEEFEG